MVTGVHASIVIERSAVEVVADLDEEGWPWLGRPGRLGGREVRLKGEAPKDFRVHAWGHHEMRRGVATWRVHLASAEASPFESALIDAQLSIETPARGRARVQLQGRAARDLTASGATVPSSVARRNANAYARSLLDLIASALEARHDGLADVPGAKRPPSHDATAPTAAAPARGSANLLGELRSA